MLDISSPLQIEKAKQIRELGNVSGQTGKVADNDLIQGGGDVLWPEN